MCSQSLRFFVKSCAIALRLFVKQSPIVLLVYSKQYIMSERIVLMMVTLTACVVQVSVSGKYYCCYRMLQKQVYILLQASVLL
jgi:hypothetical protein